MLSSNDEELIRLLREHVIRYSGVIDIQLDPDLDPPLPFNPYSQNRRPEKISHYFLLVASIDEGNIVGRAENARLVVSKMYKYFGEDLYTLQDEEAIHRFLEKNMKGGLGRLRGQIPRIIVSVNKYVSDIGGDLVEHAKKYSKPTGMADSISMNVYRMGRTRGSARKKTWMYLRWMVRPYPDLRIFVNFHPRDLYVPMDRNVARVYRCLGIINDLGNIGFKAVIKATMFARKLFPNDPAKTDYPFFLLGRTLRKYGLSLDREGLRFAIELMKNNDKDQIIRSF